MNFKQNFCVTPSEVNQRLDVVITRRLQDYSRASILRWLKLGRITCNDKIVPAKTKVHLGDIIKLDIVITPTPETSAETADLDIIFEDKDLACLNKPAGLTVHPGAGKSNGTLLNQLYYYYPEVKILPRGGIVHRLDQNTTGIMVIARSPRAHHALVNLFQKRLIRKLYRTIVQGEIKTGGTIEANIGRNHKQRILQQVRKDGRQAITHYRIHQSFKNFTELKVEITTGRTHQIRVHLSYLGYPIVGDSCYNHRVLPLTVPDKIKLNLPKRQMLHAEKLSFIHPFTQQSLELTAPFPTDYLSFQALLQQENNPLSV